MFVHDSEKIVRFRQLLIFCDEFPAVLMQLDELIFRAFRGLVQHSLDVQYSGLDVAFVSGSLKQVHPLDLISADHGAFNVNESQIVQTFDILGF